MTTLKFYAALIFLGVLSACSPEQAELQEHYSVLIINGTVYDGTLTPARNTNIGISGRRIASMDASADAQADLIIDAAGMTVVPGFIDAHTPTARQGKSGPRKT